MFFIVKLDQTASSNELDDSSLNDNEKYIPNTDEKDITPLDQNII